VAIGGAADMEGRAVRPDTGTNDPVAEAERQSVVCHLTRTTHVLPSKILLSKILLDYVS